MRTEQGMVKIKEWQPPSTIAILKETESSGTKFTHLSYFVSNYLKSLMYKEDSVDSIPVVQKSVIEKPTNNPCKSLLDVAGKDALRPSQAEFVDKKSPRKSIETTSSNLMLGGQQNKGKDIDCTSIGLTGLLTGLTASPTVSRIKLKAKMVKPKKPDIGVWKTVESKSRHKHEKEKPKPNNNLPARSRNKRISSMLVELKIPSNQNMFQSRNSMIRIGNGIIFLYRCCFHHIDHL
jgi:hypothetical protein